MLEGYTKHLFRGQVGKIEEVVLNKEEEKLYYKIEFIDYKKNRDVFYQCLVEKENLLPLFCFDEDVYASTRDEEPDGRGVNEFRERWELQKFPITPQLNLAFHKKVKKPFEVGQLVTIEVNFEQQYKTTENKIESFTIQAGQTGIISKKNISNNNVEVTFWSIHFETLAIIGKDFLPSSLFLLRKRAFNPFSFATSSWERKIYIDKNYLFPLYVENLNEENL